MKSTATTAPEDPGSKVIELRPYQKKLARQRRRAWWAGVVFGFPLARTAATKPAAETGAGELLRFRNGARAARW
jgi:hypothetical protein